MLKINREFDIPVIYISAYSDHDTMEKLNKTKHVGFIQKPYEFDSIIELVKKVLKDKLKYKTLKTFHPHG